MSAYPVFDQPVGASVPYMPHARPWNSRQINAPPLGEGRDPSNRIGASLPVDASAIAESDHPAKAKPVVIPQSRPTASVTDIPGASAPAKRIFQSASYKAAGKPIRGGVMQREMAPVEGEVEKQPTYHHTLPAVLWFAVGVVCPPFLICGCRYLNSANFTAKLLGWASMFVFGAYCTSGLILFAWQWRTDAWTGEDPSCLQYRLGETIDHTETELGSALSVYGLNAPGLGTVTSISIEKVDCAFVAQVTCDANDVDFRPRTLYVRMSQPGDTGDNFGLYVRSRGDKINPSTDPAPAQSWFEEADPTRSNAYPTDDPRYGSRPPCLVGMCNGVYSNSLPGIAGSQWEAQVPLDWYKYYMAIAVFAEDKLAEKRAFCVDTCLINHVKDDFGNWYNPCEDIELTVCEAANLCVIAKTKNDCFGVIEE